MIICKHCTKIIEIGKPYVSLDVGDFCDEKCVLDHFSEEVSKAGESYIQKECGHCFNCKETTEDTIFESTPIPRRKCKLDQTVDCDNVENCNKFQYGEPEKHVLSYTEKETTEKVSEAILYNAEKLKG